MIENKRIQIRRDIALNWSTENPILLQGEVGFDMTNNNIKIGDGIKTWNELPYLTTEVDLSEYYTKTQIDELLERIELPEDVLQQYYTKEQTDTQISTAIGNIEIPETDLSDYYTKGETDTKIDEKIESIEFPTPEEVDLSDYYTKEQTDTQITTAIGNIEIPETDLSDFYTKEQTDTQISTAIGNIEFPTPDLSDYYTQEEVDNLIETNTPDVYDSKITIQQGTKTQTFTLNQKNDALIEIEAGETDTAQWYGTEQQWVSLPREKYQDGTEYYISELSYSELKNKPFIPTRTSQLKNDRGFTTKEKVKDIIRKTEWFGTQEEFDALESYDPNVTYYVEVEQKETEYYTKAEVDALLAEIRELIQ